MVEHLVLFKLAPETTAEQKQQMISGLKALKEQIPGIIQITAGENFSSRSQGFDLGLTVRFQDRAALEQYLPHPAHRGCVDTFITPFKQDVIVVDYEIG